jgi:hypothetical protein
MPARKKTPKSRSRKSTNTLAKRPKPLLRGPDAVRKSKRGRSAPVLAPTVQVLAPTVHMWTSTQRIAAEWASLPMRLAQCRSPLELWLEQLRFGQRLLAVMSRS